MIVVVVIGHRQGFINTVPPLATSTLAVGKITEGAVAIFRGAAANPVVVHDGFIMFWDLAPALGTPVLLVRGADNVGPCVPILVEDRLVLLGAFVLRVFSHTHPCWLASLSIQESVWRSLFIPLTAR